MDYPKIIKTLRQTMVLSQTEFAHRIGCSFATVNRWENGFHEPTYKMKRKILKLCEEFAVDPKGE